MADFPSYARVQFRNFSEAADPSVHRVEMERGGPKMAVINSQRLVAVNVSLLFMSAADADSFETWHEDTIGRVGSFDFVHPRTRQTVTAWFRNGDIGTLVPIGPGWNPCSRDCVIEYLR